MFWVEFSIQFVGIPFYLGGAFIHVTSRYRLLNCEMTYLKYFTYCH